MQQIQINPVAVQKLRVVLDGQNVQIYLRKKPQGLFADVNAGGVDIVTGVLALDGVALIPRNYAGFSGNLFFLDTQGNSDPDADGLGLRFVLVYATAAEYE